MGQKNEAINPQTVQNQKPDGSDWLNQTESGNPASRSCRLSWWTCRKNGHPGFCEVPLGGVAKTENRGVPRPKKNQSSRQGKRLVKNAQWGGGEGGGFGREVTGAQDKDPKRATQVPMRCGVSHALLQSVYKRLFQDQAF